MPVDSRHQGRRYGPYRYELGLEKMREYAFAISGGSPGIGLTDPPPELNPVFYDREAGAKSPHQSVIAFPTFAVVFAIAPFGAALSDPQLGIDLLKLVHGEQELEFNGVMRPGDVMTTVGTVSEISTKAGMDFITVRTESHNQHGQLVVAGSWRAVVRR